MGLPVDSRVPGRLDVSRMPAAAHCPLYLHNAAEMHRVSGKTRHGPPPPQAAEAKCSERSMGGAVPGTELWWHGLHTHSHTLTDSEHAKFL